MIQTETTPNPESLKFLSENTISSIGTEEFRKKDIDKINNTFIKQLLNFKGVDLVLLSKNFLSVKKTKDITWEELKPMVISHLNHYYQKNKEPILNKSLPGLEAFVILRCDSHNNSLLFFPKVLKLFIRISMESCSIPTRTRFIKSSKEMYKPFNSLSSIIRMSNLRSRDLICCIPKNISLPIILD